MGKIGYGYGSEWHMLRWLGRHRHELNQKICTKLNRSAAQLEWLDFLHASKPKSLGRDREYVGINFLPAKSHPSIHSKWKTFWPSSGNSQNWDAVGKLTSSTGESEWLLVEAKANTQEIISSCGALAHGDLPHIQSSLDVVKAKVGATASVDWLNDYYQYANRLATLHFLISNHINAHLIFIYFCGDSCPRKDCPIDEKGWAPALAKQDAHLKLPTKHIYSDYIHKIFLNV